MTIDGKTSLDVTNNKKTGEDHVDDQVTLNKQDQDKNPLDGATFGVFDNDKGTGTALKTFTAGTAIIKTDDTALASKLPAVGESVTMYVIETEAPA